MSFLSANSPEPKTNTTSTEGSFFGCQRMMNVKDENRKALACSLDRFSTKEDMKTIPHMSNSFREISASKFKWV